MKYSQEEIIESLKNIGHIIDIGCNSINQTNIRYSTREIPREIKMLNIIWNQEYDHKRDLILYLQDYTNNTTSIESALEFIDKECFILPEKITDTIQHIWENDKIMLSSHFLELEHRYASFFYKNYGKIKILEKRFAEYQGKTPITEERIKSWLLQFLKFKDEERSMYLALCLLNGVKFVRKEELISAYLESLNKNEKEISLIYECTTAKEGTLAREKDFIDAFHRNEHKFKVIKNLHEITKKREQFLEKLILIIDDVIGSGKQYVDILDDHFNIEKIETKYIPNDNKLINIDDRIIVTNLFWKIIIYSCPIKSAEEIKKKAISFGIKNFEIWSKIKPEKCLDNNKNPDGDPIFKNTNDLSEALQMFHDIGVSIFEKEHALGYNNSQQLIVFSHKPPNNTLPILWRKGVYKDITWDPLFPRPEEI